MNNYRNFQESQVSNFSPSYSNSLGYYSGNGVSSPYHFGSSNQNQGDRFIGGFVFPFLLGGVTGAAIAPAFFRPPYNGPFYGPGFYGPYRPF
jgi:hypothetical protein